MERKIMSESELLSRREELIEKYNSQSRQSNKPFILSKRERKVLGIGRDQGKATLNYARISPRKVKIVLDLIKGKDLAEAYAIVKFTPKEKISLDSKFFEERFLGNPYTYVMPTFFERQKVLAKKEKFLS